MAPILFAGALPPPSAPDDAVSVGASVLGGLWPVVDMLDDRLADVPEGRPAESENVVELVDVDCVEEVDFALLLLVVKAKYWSVVGSGPQPM